MLEQEPTRQRKSRYSYKDAITEVVRRRMAEREPLTVREIIEEAGGGSNDTVKAVIEEMEKMRGRASLLVGARARDPKLRITALEEALDESANKEKVLIAENTFLKAELEASRSNVERMLGLHEKLISQHDTSQKKLLQGVDDLRQMVRAGQGGLPSGILAAERAKQGIVEPVGDALFWKAKYDKLMSDYRKLEAHYEDPAKRLDALGHETEK